MTATTRAGLEAGHASDPGARRGGALGREGEVGERAPFGAGAAALTEGGSGPRVLVVDDERKTLEISRDILELAGYAVETAQSGQEALDRLVAASFRAVVTDIRMPGIGGIELLQRIRRAFADLPVIILTGHATLETAAKAVEHGAFEYLFKPIDFDALKRSLARAIDRYDLVLQNRRLVAELRAVNEELCHVNLDLERRVAERTRELTLERDLLDGVFAEIPSALAVLDARGRPLRENPAWTGLGVAAEVARERLEAEAARRATRAGEPEGDGAAAVARRELAVEGADGAPRRLAAAWVPLAGGRALVVLDDRTTERRLEDELLHAEKLGSLGTLAGGIVHDLTNPVTAVLGALDMLADRLPAAAEGEEHEIIRAAAEHMRAVCEGLSDFARRASSGERARCDLNALVERALAFARFSRRFDGVRAVLELAPASPVVEAHPTELVQVILNLLLNAADASPAGEPVVVRTREDAPAGQVVVEVEDRGAGVPAELRERIFEAFFTTKPRGRGTGLGLYIARRVLRRLAGDVVVEAAPAGRGALFRVLLPASAGAAALASAPREASGERRGGSGASALTRLLR